MSILYKYLTFEGAEKLLEAQTLLFSRPHFFNDPFDSTARNEENMSFYQNFYQHDKFVFCLTRSPSNALMWAHYGDEHRGLVIGFDTDKIPELKENCIIPVNEGEVIYTRTRPPKNDDIKKNFLYKSLEWSYEEEVRVVKYASNPVDREEDEAIGCEALEHLDCHSKRAVLNFPPEAISEIYLGAYIEGNVEIDDSDPHYGGDEYTHDTIHFIPGLVEKIQSNYPHAKINLFRGDSHSWDMQLHHENYLANLIEGYRIYKDEGYDEYRHWLTR